MNMEIDLGERVDSHWQELMKDSTWEKLIAECVDHLKDSKKVIKPGVMPSGFEGQSIKNSVYYFQVKLPKALQEEERFQKTWDEDRGIKDSYPKVNTKRLKELDAQLWKDWVPFYVGKYTGSLKTRINQHVVVSKVSGTGALKLARSMKQFKDWEFRLSWFSLGDQNISRILLSFMEETMRDRLGPIVGSEG